MEVKQRMYVSPHALHYDCLPTFRHLLGIWVLNLAQGDARSSASLCGHARQCYSGGFPSEVICVLSTSTHPAGEASYGGIS